ncbi:PH domain-containing protein [Clostridium oryzae]|uniref:Bacterial membrane flanked domain protein n=1 Tax=Clostridium oryzae TaxID=1450648 RepID=A0A1V4IDV2_9CLOT|nr:PH domain-containing protein [Clostridium oryzae]OPJ57835.1 bacterial membrane flanked domain protein [Clostridium oryzae]
MNNNLHNHRFIILSYFINEFKNFWFIVPIIFAKKISLFIPALALIGIYSIIISFIRWSKTLYWLNEATLSYRTGVFSIKNIETPYNKITTFDIDQTVIHKIFNLHKVKLDTGAPNKKDEIVLLLDKHALLDLKQNIGHMENPQSTNAYDISGSDMTPNRHSRENTICATTKDLLLYSLTQNNLAILLGIALSADQFINNISDVINIDINKNISGLANNIHSIASILILFITFIIISTIFSSIIFIIKYGNYKVYRSNDLIRINYGLLSNKTYSFKLNKINAVTMKQNLLRQFFKLYKLQISAVGYGDEKDEEALLFPLCTKIKADFILSELLPEFQFSNNMYTVPKRGGRRFFTLPITIFIAVASVIIIIFTKTLVIFISFLILLLTICSCFLQYRNSALGFNNNVVYTASGGIFKSITIIPIYQIQAISYKQSYFQKVNTTCNYNFYYFGKAGSVSSKNLDQGLRDNVLPRYIPSYLIPQQE